MCLVSKQEKRHEMLSSYLTEICAGIPSKSKDGGLESVTGSTGAFTLACNSDEESKLDSLKVHRLNLPLAFRAREKI